MIRSVFHRPPFQRRTTSTARQSEVADPVVAAYRLHVQDPNDPDGVHALRLAARQSGFDAAIGARLRAVCRGRQPSVGVAGALSGLDPGDRLNLLRAVFELCLPLRAVAYPARDPVTANDEVASLGISIKALQRTGDNQPPRGRAFAYHERVLHDGRIELASPLSGRPLSSSASLLLGSDRPLIVYHFVDDGEPFFLFTNSNNGCWYGLFLPERNLMISLPAETPHAMAMFRALMTEFARETVEHLAYDAERPRALVVGMMSHFGLTVLNEYEACHQFAEAGLLDRVDLVLQGPTNYAPHTEVFPELCAQPVVRVDDEAAAYRTVVQGRYLVSRPTCNYWFSAGLGRRLGSAAARHVRARPSAELAAARRRFPLLWVEIRSNDRRWVDQAEQVPQLIGRLAVDFPRLGVVLAGWSRMVDTYRYDETMTASDRAVCDAIRRRVAADVPIFETAGMQTLEKFAWALECDAFVCTYGTGLIFPAYAARIPGVVHANTAYRIRISSLHCDELDEIHLIDRALVVDEDPEEAPGERNHFLDWRPVHEALIALLGGARPASGE